MGEFKGTPGPWIKDVRKSKIMAIIPKLYGKRVVETNLITGTIHDDDCGNPKCCCVEEHANAQLIAAAPELLKALEDLVHLHMCEQEGLSSGQPSSSDWLKAVDQAIEAISKVVA